MFLTFFKLLLLTSRESFRCIGIGGTSLLPTGKNDVFGRQFRFGHGTFELNPKVLTNLLGPLKLDTLQGTRCSWVEVRKEGSLKEMSTLSRLLHYDVH